MKKILFSVAIALYNNKKTIRKCLETVLNQTYRNIEIIIVDDGSTDNSLSQINEFMCDKRIAVYKKENGGLSSARQMALEKAKGQYISFIDADDYVEESYVEDFLNSFTKNNTDICVCGTKFINADGNELSKMTQSYMVSDSNMFIVDAIHLKKHYQKLASLFHMSDSWNKAYLTKYIRQASVEFCLPKGYNGTDLAFNYKLLLHQPKICTISRNNYIHIIYESSAVHRKNKELLFGFNYICSQIIEESQKCDLLVELSMQMSSLYLGLLRTDLQDVYNETKGINAKKQKLLRHIEIANEFMRDNNLNNKMLPDDTKSMRFFKKAILKKSIFRIYLYLLYRKIIMSLNGLRH